MYWTLELASKLEDAPWPATKDELIDYAMRSGAPMEVVENLQELEDEGEIYETIEDVWPDYPTKEDFLFDRPRKNNPQAATTFVKSPGAVPTGMPAFVSTKAGCGSVRLPRASVHESRTRGNETTIRRSSRCKGNGEYGSHSQCAQNPGRSQRARCATHSRRTGCSRCTTTTAERCQEGYPHCRDSHFNNGLWGIGRLSLVSSKRSYGA